MIFISLSISARYESLQSSRAFIPSGFDRRRVRGHPGHIGQLDPSLGYGPAPHALSKHRALRRLDAFQRLRRQAAQRAQAKRRERGQDQDRLAARTSLLDVDRVNIRKLTT